MNSRVHPKYRTKYRVTNWPEYGRGLVERGGITAWLSPDAIAEWKPVPSSRRGGQRKYSDLAIETALALRTVFQLPLRQTEGFLNSIFWLMRADLCAPDHTTLSRRSLRLDVAPRREPAAEPIHLVIDSTGLSVMGQGEWAAAKHGGKGKRGWKRLHLGVDGCGVIVADVLTEGHADDAAKMGKLLNAVEGDITRVVADAAYDAVAVYHAASARGVKVIVPPTRTAVASRRGPRSVARDRTIKRVEEVGRRQWKKESGHHQQCTAENVLLRYKSIPGDRLRARSWNAQMAEALTGCNVLNRMLDLGRPASVGTGA